MSAIRGSRFQTQDRVKLAEVIPLSTPYLLFIDPSSVCNFKCTFCPCGGGNKECWDRGKKVNILSYSLYRDIIDQLTEFTDKIKTLRLYKEGEPLLNKRLPDMIQYARRKNIAHKIDMTTNGSLLTEDLNFALIDAGIDRINISVEALDEDGYRTHAGVPIDIDKYKRTLRHLYIHKGKCHILIKITDVGLGEHSEEEFYQAFGEFCDEISIEHVTPVWPDFDLGHVKKEFKEGIYGGTIEGRVVCPYLFYSMCVNSDGTVSSCFMDWNHKNLIGDCKDQKLVEIWKYSALETMRRYHLQGKRGMYPVCANCGQLSYAALDNLDPYKEELLKKMGY